MLGKWAYGGQKQLLNNNSKSVHLLLLNGATAQCAKPDWSSIGFVKRQMLTLVGQVEWKRRVGRCPHRCLGSQQIPFDVVLGIHAYQPTGCGFLTLGEFV